MSSQIDLDIDCCGLVGIAIYTHLFLGLIMRKMVGVFNSDVLPIPKIIITMGKRDA